MSLHLTVRCDVSTCGSFASVDKFDHEPVCVSDYGRPMAGGSVTQIVPDDSWIDLPAGWTFVQAGDDDGWSARCPTHNRMVPRPAAEATP